MSAASNDPPKLAVPPVAAAPAEEPLEVVPDEPEAFAVAAPSPAPALKATNWYVGRGGRREGPFDLSQLQQEAQSGALKEADLLWREGMAGWTAAREVPEVFAPAVAPAAGPVHVPSAASAPAVAPSPPPAAAPYKPAAKPSELLAPLEQYLARPSFYRMAGYIAGGLGALAILASLAFWYWGRTWFGGAATLIAIFFVCQATAAILDAVQRGPGKPGDRGGGGA